MYLKKISFGISLSISLEDYTKIINKYLPYLSSVYFSLPFGQEFHTRSRVIKEYSDKEAAEKLLKILKLFKKNGIKLEAIINQYNIKPDILNEALDKLDNLIKVDSICCLDEYVDIIKGHYNNDIYLISSFNNKIIHKDNVKKLNDDYDMIVVSREFLRDAKLIKIIRESTNKEIKLLLNNGCSFNCGTCRKGGGACKEVFRENLKRHNPKELYAKQSFFPWELKKLFNELDDSNTIKELKISNRPCTYEYLDKCLESYIFNKGENIYVENDYKWYHLWGRQSNLTPYFKTFNIDEINELKKKIWKKNKMES